MAKLKKQIKPKLNQTKIEQPENVATDTTVGIFEDRFHRKSLTSLSL